MAQNRFGAVALLAAGHLTAAGGCCPLPPAASGVSLPPPPAAPWTADPVAVPKEHVHIFAVNGSDPLCIAGFDGLCDRLREHGYVHTRFGRLCTSHRFAPEIRRLRAVDPCARVVVIGYSTGCNYARSIVNGLNRDGVGV